MQKKHGLEPVGRLAPSQTQSCTGGSPVECMTNKKNKKRNIIKKAKQIWISSLVKNKKEGMVDPVIPRIASLAMRGADCNAGTHPADARSPPVTWG